MQVERLKRVEECNKNEHPFAQKIKACLAIPFTDGESLLQKMDCENNCTKNEVSEEGLRRRLGSPRALGTKWRPPPLT